MKSPGIIGRFKRSSLAFAYRHSHYLPAFVWTFLFCAALQFLPFTLLWWVLGFCSLLFFPFDSVVRRFWPALHEHWNKHSTPVTATGQAIATGAAFTLIGLLSFSLEKPYFRHALIEGLVIVAGGSLALLISRLIAGPRPHGIEPPH